MSYAISSAIGGAIGGAISGAISGTISIRSSTRSDKSTMVALDSSRLEIVISIIDDGMSIRSAESKGILEFSQLEWSDAAYAMTYY